LNKHKPYIDLSHTINTHIPTWEKSCGFSLHNDIDYDQGARVQSLSMVSGLGTHIDAPAHFIPDGKTIADITVNKLVSRMYIVDMHDRFTRNRVITAEDIQIYEEKYGLIHDGDVVVFYTGWHTYWSYPYLYVDNYPTLSACAALYLASKNINGCAIDTLSPDARDSDFSAHHILLSHDIYIIENIAYNDYLSSYNTCTIVVAPLPIERGTESPCRVYAF
jgi:kynurenine formamidase